MKTFIIIASIFLFTEIHQSVAGEETTNDTEVEVNKSSIKPKLPKENQKSLKAKLDEMKEKATNRRKTAIDEGRPAYEEAKQKAEQLIDDADPEYNKQQDIAIRKYEQADLLAKAIRRNKLNQLADIMHRIDDEYKQKEEDAKKKSEALLREAEEEFIKVCVEIENKKKDAENKYNDALDKGRNARQNAVEAAEERKGLAEKELWEAANQYKIIPPEEWAKVKAKYIKEMEAYEEALQLADSEWKKVLEEAGLGKKYEDALDKAFAEFKEKQDSALSTKSKLQSECDKDLQEAKKEMENKKRQLDDDRGKVRAAYNKASLKAQDEYEDAMEDIEKRRKKYKALANIEVKVARDEFNEVIRKADMEFQKVMKEVEKMMVGMDGTTEPAKNVSGFANGRQRRVQTPRRRIFDTNTGKWTYRP